MRADLDHSRSRAEAHSPAVRATNSAFGSASAMRNASPPVTPPASTGSISSGRNATRAHKLVRPDEPSFPSSTSNTLTRVINSSPRVPSRRSELIRSAVSKQAAQLKMNPAPTMAFRRRSDRCRSGKGTGPHQLRQATQQCCQHHGKAHPVGPAAPRPHPQLALDDRQDSHPLCTAKVEGCGVGNHSRLSGLVSLCNPIAQPPAQARPAWAIR